MSTRSGAIYNRAVTSSAVTSSAVTSSAVTSSESVGVTDSVKRSTRILTTKLKEDKSSNPYGLRSASGRSVSFSTPYIREYVVDSDNDSTSTYNSKDDDEEDEEIQSYTKNIFQPIAQKYEVCIDFDEASAAWRSNKRRVGESWVYKKKVNAKRPSVNEKKQRLQTPAPTMVTRSSSRRR
jgi:hypothetical protein